jgi:hypothetical protein
LLRNCGDFVSGNAILGRQGSPVSQPKVSLREELVFILNQAAELEHSLACSYLFTAFSLKNAPDERLPEAALPQVQS